MIIFQIFFFKLYINCKYFSIILPSSLVIKIEVLVLILLLFICINVKYPAHWAEGELVTTLTKHYHLPHVDMARKRQFITLKSQIPD